MKQIASVVFAFIESAQASILDQTNILNVKITILITCDVAAHRSIEMRLTSFAALVRIRLHLVDDVLGFRRCIG
ncbi:MAG TPA: hypothetical protein VH143_12685, partial [Kofleriaceae bacterium]|nr:hypothetical protein [Kofleriaceae bacterium]